MDNTTTLTIAHRKEAVMFEANKTNRSITLTGIIPPEGIVIDDIALDELILLINKLVEK